MKEIVGNIWDYYRSGHDIVITTNGTVKKNRECVMGRGVALQAKQKFPELPRLLGASLCANGNHVNYFPNLRLYVFPVKHRWWEKADVELIKRSCQELVRMAIGVVYLVRPGCGNGQLNWEDIKSEIELYLSDNFIIVNNS